MNKHRAAIVLVIILVIGLATALVLYGWHAYKEHEANTTRQKLYDSLKLSRMDDFKEALGKCHDIGLLNQMLITAAWWKETEAVALLLDKGVDVNTRNENYETPLHFASENGDTEMAKLLLDGGADMNIRNGAGDIPLEVAVSKGQTEAVSLLLGRIADVKMYIGSFNSSLLTAAGEGHTEIAELLLDKGAYVNTEFDNEIHESDHSTPLHSAAYEGHADTAELLLERGADVNATTSGPEEGGGITPLMDAAMGGHTEVVALLLDWGADVNARTYGYGIGNTALYYAGGHPDTEALLRQYGGVE